MIDLRDMKELEIDTEARTAWAQTGLTALDVTTAAWEHKLAIGFGDTGSVGIGGITLGGGVGYMGRKHGLTIDNLLDAEIVTRRRLDAHGRREQPSRTCSGQSAVVAATSASSRGSSTSSTRSTRTSAACSSCRRPPRRLVASSRPRRTRPMRSRPIANVMNAPPMPFLPEDVVGKLIIFAFIGHTGEERAGGRGHETLPVPGRALCRLPEADALSGDVSARGRVVPAACDRPRLLHGLGRSGMAQTIIDRLNASDAPLRAAQLRVLGGAMARVPADATAYAHRDKKIMAIAVNFYEGEEDLPRRLGVARRNGRGNGPGRARRLRQFRPRGR